MLLLQRDPRLLSSKAAFTILELVVAIAILGTLAVVGTTVIQAERQGERVLAVTNELAGWLEAVRRAAERGIACDVAIPDNPAATSTTNVATATPQAAAIANNCLQNSPFRIESGREIDQYSISSNINDFTFTPRGSVFVEQEGGEVIQVQLQAVEAGEAVGKGHCVRVEPPLGFIGVGDCEAVGGQP